MGKCGKVFGKALGNLYWEKAMPRISIEEAKKRLAEGWRLRVKRVGDKRYVTIRLGGRRERSVGPYSEELVAELMGRKPETKGTKAKAEVEASPAQRFAVFEERQRLTNSIKRALSSLRNIEPKLHRELRGEVHMVSERLEFLLGLAKEAETLGEMREIDAILKQEEKSLSSGSLWERDLYLRLAGALASVGLPASWASSLVRDEQIATTTLALLTPQGLNWTLRELPSRQAGVPGSWLVAPSSVRSWHDVFWVDTPKPAGFCLTWDGDLTIVCGLLLSKFDWAREETEGLLAKLKKTKEIEGASPSA